MNTKLTTGDLQFAANILENYFTDGADKDFPESAASLNLVVQFLDAEIARRNHIVAVNQAKRAYAAEHGVPFKSVRYTKAKH